MKKLKRAGVKGKKLGRPRLPGKGVQIHIRCRAEFLARVDEWQARKAPEHSQPQAIKELAEIGLRVEIPPNAPFEVFRIPIKKSQLRAIPVGERNLLLLASHAVNQLLIFRKLLIFSVNYRSDNELESTLSAAQSQTILRVLFGALAEAWETIRRPINQKLLGSEYATEIEQEGLNAYDDLKKHFGTSNLLHKLRNTIAYHHPSGADLEAAFEDVPEDEDWAWYPAETINNSFYFASDMVISAGVMRLTGERDAATAFGKVMGEVVTVSNVMTDFLLFVMRAIVARHFGAEVLSPRRGTGTMINGAPNLYKVPLPFFTVRDDDPSQRS